jgi:hypothetical protein
MQVRRTYFIEAEGLSFDKLQKLKVANKTLIEWSKEFKTNEELN